METGDREALNEFLEGISAVTMNMLKTLTGRNATYQQTLINFGKGILNEVDKFKKDFSGCEKTACGEDQSESEIEKGKSKKSTKKKENKEE